ncbi:MAG: pirin family protein [Pseudomonadota bacterium]
MIAIRHGAERGHANHGWLDTYHTFSFADYHDPRHMGFSVLRVINEDVVAPGQGFPTHPHRDMEIITWILEGALEHQDSLGTGSVIRPGEVQRMSAGSGIRHSEFNPSPAEAVHLLQIWILPNQQGVTPSYEQTHFDDAELANRLRLVASPDGQDGSVTIHQNARVYAARLRNGAVTHTLGSGRRAWVQVARGALTLNGQKLAAGDGAAIEQETVLRLTGNGGAELLLFDLP